MLDASACLGRCQDGSACQSTALVHTEIIWQTIGRSGWNASQRLELPTAARTPRLNSFSQNQCSISHPHRSFMDSNAGILYGVLGLFISWETIKYVDDSSTFLIFYATAIDVGYKKKDGVPGPTDYCTKHNFVTFFTHLSETGSYFMEKMFWCFHWFLYSLL